MRTYSVMSAYFAARDAAANPLLFPHYLIGAFAVLVDAAIWELAIEAAQDTDRREAEKAARTAS